MPPSPGAGRLSYFKFLTVRSTLPELLLVTVISLASAYRGVVRPKGGDAWKNSWEALPHVGT